MGKLKIVIFAALAVAIFSSSALAKTYTINFKGAGHGQVGIWGIELYLLVSAPFYPVGATLGDAVPADWDLSVRTTTWQGQPAYVVTLNQDFFTNPLTYLDNGELLTIEFTGTVLGLLDEPSTIYDESYDNKYLHPFRIYSKDENGFTLMPPLITPSVSLIIP